MATNTYVQMVSDAEIAALQKAPATIGALDKPSSECFSTYHFTAINYFLTGDAYPSKKHALGALLSGEKSVSTSTLENGAFAINRAATVATLSAALSKVDLKALAKAVKDADLDELRDEDEVDEEYALGESEDPAKELVAAVKSLQKFYESAVKKGLGVVIYTT